MLQHPLLFSELLGIPETYKHVFYTWMAIIILFIVGLFIRGRTKMVPTGVQNFMEVVVGGLEEYAVGVIGEKARKVVPYLVGIFLFIVSQNLIGLLPGCDAATASLNTTAALAVLCFVYYNAVGLRRWGPGYIKHFMGPMLPLAPLMLPLELISHLSRPLSLALRLFGNIRGEEIVLMIFFSLVVLFPPTLVGTVPIYFLFLMMKCLQGFIFYMLSMLYLQGAMEHAH